MANMTLTKTPMPEQDPKVRARNFEEVALGYTAEQAMDCLLYTSSSFWNPAASTMRSWPLAPSP